MSKPYENPTEMKEFKPSLIALTAWWLSRHLILVGFIVALILSLVGCQKAKAESIPPSAREYFDECSIGALTNLSTAETETYNAFVNTCFGQQYIYAYDYHYYSATYHIFLFAPSSSIGVWGTYGTPRPLNLANNSTSNYPVYCVMFQTGGVQLITFNNPGFNAYWDVLGWNKYSQSYSTNLQSGTTFQFGTTANGFDGNVKSNGGNFALIIYNRSTDYGYSAAYQTATVFPSYTEDSRLKFALINDTYEGETLMTDIRQFMSDFAIQDTSHSSAYLDPESIILKYTVDGTEKTITLNSSNSTIRSKYIFETPVYQFDFDDENTSVIITSADFTISGTSQSAPYSATETYRIATNYPIRRSNPLPIPTPIADPTYNDVSANVEDPATVLQEITEQLTNDSTTTNAFTGEWTLDQTHPTVPSWADNYDFRVIKSDFNSIISSVVNADVWNYYTSNDPNLYDWITGGFNPRNFVDENRNFAFYDMIIISVYEANITWDPNSANPSLIYQNIHLLGYITLYSQRYYVHKSAITDNNILAAIEYSSMNDVAFYETVKAQIDQFEEYTLGRLDAQLSIEKDSLAWLKTISSKIDEIEPYNDTSLLSKLDSILTKLTQIAGKDNNEDDTVSEAIAYYRANNDNGSPTSKVFTDNKMSIWLSGKVHFWLQGSNANEDKTGFLTATFDVLTSMYDSMQNEYGFFSSLNGYLYNLAHPSDIEDPEDNYLSFFFDSDFDPDTYEGVAVNE